VRAVPRLCKFYPGISLTTEGKARKNLSQVKKNLKVRKTLIKVGKTSVKVKENLSQSKNLNQIKNSQSK